MKLPSVKTMILNAIIMAMTFAEAHAFGEIKLEDAKKIVPEYQTVRIIKEKNQYFLEYKSHALINPEGEQVTYGEAGRSYKILRRDIKMPVSIKVENKSGFGKKLQFLGFGDDDVSTGDFKNLEKQRLGDLLTTYEGTSTNIGITFIGGGYTSMTSASGVTLKEGNGSIMMIGPAGTPIGINMGLQRISFDLTISSPLKAVLVEYQLELAGKERTVLSKVKEVQSLDEVLQLELK